MLGKPQAPNAHLEPILIQNPGMDTLEVKWSLQKLPKAKSNAFPPEEHTFFVILDELINLGANLMERLLGVRSGL